MNRLVRLITALFFFLGFFATTAVAQVTNTNFFWGGGISNSWGTAANWSTTGRFVHTANYSSGVSTISIVTPNLVTTGTVLAVGHAIVGVGIPDNTTVASFSATPANGTTITLSQPTTGVGSAAIIQTYLKASFGPFATTGTVSAGTTSTAVIDNAAINSPIVSTNAVASIVLIRNTFGPITGPTLTINPSSSLTVTNFSASPFQIAGGNIVNNGTLNITSNSTGASTGIACNSPNVLPTSGINEYGYSGNGTLNINISASTTANSAAINVSSLNAFTTYKMLVNTSSTTFTLGSAATSSAFRIVGGTAASPVIIGGTGVTLGTVGTPSTGGLVSLGGGATVTVDTGTTLTFNSSVGNVNTLIGGFSASAVATNFTNKGTINLQGATARSGLGFSTGSSAVASVFNINNEGTLNINLNCATAGHSALNIGNGGGGNANVGSAVNVTNTGTMTLKNTAATAGTGFSIYCTNTGEAPPLFFTNNGTLNLEGTVYNFGTKTTINNAGVINSNSEFKNFTAINNNAGGSINFVKTAATATSRQVVFNGLTSTDLSGSIGTVYSDGTNSYVLVTQKYSGTTTLVANVLSSATVGTGSGVLTASSGTSPITFTSVTVTSINGALTSTTTNLGTINTDTASNLNIISSVTNASTGVISPGGSAGKGIASFTGSSKAISGKLIIQVAGNTTAGVDYDQITNSDTNGGFDISTATLEISSLYAPNNSVTIPIVTASGTGTISGAFASVTGLTAGWSLVYYSSTVVNLVYTRETIWTGAAADNDFFNEANWKDAITNAVPAANTINPGVNINLGLQINVNATITATGGAIQFGSGSLAIGLAKLNATSFSGGSITVNDRGYVDLSSASPFLNNVQINFTSGIGWIRTLNYTPTAVSANNLAQIRVNNIASIYTTNLRLDNYYLNGCVVRANLVSTTPVTVYDGSSLGGTSGLIEVDKIFSTTAIVNSLDNKIESFILRKGFMLTVANEIDGTGKSMNYIASEDDLVVNTLPNALQNSISFIRVVPWNWVTKKGVNLTTQNVNATWRYRWNPDESSTLDFEFAPMSWGQGSIDDAAGVANFVRKYKSPYAMSFNEPDNCFDQSGQYGNPKLCVIDEAVRWHKNLMKTGLRIVSPGCREEAAKEGGWLKEFYDKATAQDVRIDVIAVHWYDWGSSPTTTDNATGAQVFNRFKSYLTNVYNTFGLPIWITEFNANPARSNQVNADFLALALPYLESLSYIERYCLFPYNIGTDYNVLTSDNPIVDTGVLAPVGIVYKGQVSTPAVPELTLTDNSNLNVVDYPNVAFNKPVTASSNYSTYVPANAVDGNKTDTASRWLVEFGTKPLPAWIEVDLQGSFTIYGFRTFELTNTIKNFQFQVWDTTLNSGLGGWSTALNVASNPATPLTTYKTITPVTTTKVRLYITTHNSTDYLRMFEFEVYGLPRNPSWTGATSSVWTLSSNWLGGIVPDQFSNVLIPGGKPFQPTISSTLKINSLTIDSGATVTVLTGVNLTVVDAIINRGIMTMANNSNLLQSDTLNNSGNITITRNSNALSLLDYTIWSSPVTNSSQFLTTFSPLTFATRFYNYNELTNQFNVVIDPKTTPFSLANGYLIRMPNNAVAAPMTQTFPGVFTGVPNNTTIDKAVTYKGTIYGYNMMGNPYPSTIDADQFINYNTGKIEPYLYFWRKKNGATGSAYAVYGLLGGTATASSEVPNGVIQVGQGFFVKATKAGNVSFSNNMRVADNVNQTFRIAKSEKDRLWLNLTSTSGVFSQTLIGYLNDATKGLDQFDSKYINDSQIALTSNIDNEEYSIQGRPVFDVTDVVALNFKTDIQRDYTIALEHFEGVFAKGQDIYLLDSKTGIETNLKNGSYTFAALAGIDNNRFSLKYQKTLKIDAPIFNENNVKVYKNGGTLYVISQFVAIGDIKVFDIQGRLIAEQNNVKATTAALKTLKATHQVLIVKVTGEDNSIVAKKVIN